MKTAVLISGQARSFAATTINPRASQPWARACFANQYWYFLRHLEDPQFFVSLANDQDAAAVEPLLQSRFPKSSIHVEIVDQPKLEEPNITACCHSAYCISVEPQNILRDFWHRQRVFAFYRDHLASQHIKDYDMVIRLRPDLYFQRITIPCIPARHIANHCYTPFWGKYGGVNDRLAIMGRRAAEVYFTAFDSIGSLLAAGCPFHPETMLGAALEFGCVESHPMLDAHFYTLRKNGEIVWQRIEESIQGAIELQTSYE